MEGLFTWGWSIPGRGFTGVLPPGRGLPVVGHTLEEFGECIMCVGREWVGA